MYRQSRGNWSLRLSTKKTPNLSEVTPINLKLVRLLEHSEKHVFVVVATINDDKIEGN